MPERFVTTIASAVSLEPTQLLIAVLAVLFVFFLTWAIWEDRAKLLAIAGGFKSRRREQRRRASMSDYERRRQKFNSSNARELFESCLRMLNAYPSSAVDEDELEECLNDALEFLSEVRIHEPVRNFKNLYYLNELRNFMNQMRGFSQLSDFESAARYAERHGAHQHDVS